MLYFLTISNNAEDMKELIDTKCHQKTDKKFSLILIDNNDELVVIKEIRFNNGKYINRVLDVKYRTRLKKFSDMRRHGLKWFLKISKPGDYVLIHDGDDWMSDNVVDAVDSLDAPYEVLLPRSFTSIYDDKTTDVRYISGLSNKEMVDKYTKFEFMSYLGGKAMEHKFLKKYFRYYPKGVRYYDDAAMSYAMYAFSKSYKVPDYVYFYDRRRTGAETHGSDVKNHTRFKEMAECDIKTLSLIKDKSVRYALASNNIKYAALKNKIELDDPVYLYFQERISKWK